VVDDAIVLDIGVESGNHSLSEPSARAPGDVLHREVPFNVKPGGLFNPLASVGLLNLTQAFFHGQSAFFQA
jgi:hypothetical protein